MEMDVTLSIEVFEFESLSLSLSRSLACLKSDIVLAVIVGPNYIRVKICTRPGKFT